jgi:hypothetical protein
MNCLNRTCLLQAGIKQINGLTGFPPSSDACLPARLVRRAKRSAGRTIDIKFNNNEY